MSLQSSCDLYVALLYNYTTNSQERKILAFLSSLRDPFTQNLSVSVEPSRSIHAGIHNLKIFPVQVFGVLEETYQSLFETGPVNFQNL